MNINSIAQLRTELNIMDLNNLKPNYAELARKYGLDYRTVKKYHEGFEGKAKSRDKPSKLDKHIDVIKEKLEIPRISKKGVYEWLVDKYGFNEIGSYSNFKTYCTKHKLKKSNIQSGGSTRFETEPGDLAECDWKEDIQLISNNGELVTVNIFHLVLKFSRFSYLELTLSKEQNVVFRCLINAFKAYGGIPKRILFDNMSTVIDTSVKPKRVNNKMVQFAKDFNFKVTSCKARHAYTKGSNEARNKILDWIRAYNNDFETLEDLQNKVEKINIKMNLEICEGTDIAPCVLYYKEKEYLNRLPDTSVIEKYLAPTKVKVSPQQLITYNGIKYSVDKKYTDESVYLEEFDGKLQIYYKGKLIQIHQISNNPINYAPEHYKQSLEKVIKKENIDEIVLNNLKIMDKLLDMRTVDITKESASKSNAALLSYLVSNKLYGKQTSRIIQSLTKENIQILLQELRKILPYVDDEEQFFLAFKHAVKKEDLRHVRIDLWELDLMECYSFLTQEGYDSIYKDFKEEVENRMTTMKERWG